MEIRIRHDVFIHTHPEQDSDIVKLLQELKILNINIMASLEQFQSALDRIDAATTKIAGQLRDLKDQITNAGLPAELEQQVLTRLETSATQLEAVGTSVENPAPVIPEA